MMEQKSIFGKCRVRSWTRLFSGGVLISGGLGWCLSPSLKEQSNKWMILTVFVIGSTGVSLARSAIGNVHRKNKARPAPEPISSKIGKLDVTDRNRLPESDLFLLINVVHKMTKMAALLDSSEEKCDSCVDTLEKFYNTLFQYTESINAGEQSSLPLFDLIEELLKDYKAERGYPNVIKRYGEVVPPRFEELSGKMIRDLKFIKIHAQGLIANEWPIELHNIFNISDECISKFLLSPDVTKEHRKAICRTIQAILVLSDKVLLRMKNEFRPRVRRVMVPFFKCKKESELIEVLEKLLFYYRVRDQLKS